MVSVQTEIRRLIDRSHAVHCIRGIGGNLNCQARYQLEWVGGLALRSQTGASLIFITAN